MPGPLAGIRIVDCTAYIAGPFATMVLADQGADVVKIEPLGLGRSKRSLALDLRDERGRKILRDLVATADVFVQNFRPGVVKSLGIDEPALRGACPDLVYCSVSAFGQKGPWSNRPAFDHIIQAASGLAAVQADRETGEPHFVRNAMVDKLTALTASQAITAALLHRARTGEGQHVELSMLDSAVHFLWPDGMARDALVGDGVELRPPLADAYQMILLKDGYAAVGAITQEQVHGAMRAVGRPEFIHDERFSTANALLANLAEFISETEAAAAQMTVDEFVANFEREDVPCAAVVTPGQVMEHPQVVANGAVEEVEHPVLGRMRRPLPPARFSASPAGVSRDVPTLGEHGDELLAELGLSEAERAELCDQGIVG
jgi:crotonobetainyl-CoA:carnitine CoA-transferase CaiB-like acyl-CoA transferase